MRLIILGAGMAGLLTGNILRRHSPVLLEAQKTLPDNHGALLRFRSDAVSKVTGQPFRRVRVHKAIKVHGQSALQNYVDIRSANMYALKIGGEVMCRSIFSLESVDRYVAPDDFVRYMSVGLDIRYNNLITASTFANLMKSQEADAIISTLPMPVMMEMVDWKDRPEFRWQGICSINTKIVAPHVDVFQTIYYPGPEPWYRASITGDRLTVEMITDSGSLSAEDVIRDILGDFGISYATVENVEITHQKYGKLLPIDESIRRSFIFGLSSEFGIYSVGRFATWRQILLDDVVNDVNRVYGFISDKDQYSQHLST